MLHGLLISLFSGALAVSALPQPVAGSALATLNERFVCPETLPNDEARQQASSKFVASYDNAYASGALTYWHVLLKTHGCKEAPPPRVTVFDGRNGAPFVFGSHVGR
ncbi:MAG TPA: hypothetical protein VGI95_09150 [Caulobacteraceae bacterium]|jgi:acyl dehydratase